MRHQSSDSLSHFFQRHRTAEGGFWRSQSGSKALSFPPWTVCPQATPRSPQPGSLRTHFFFPSKRQHKLLQSKLIITRLIFRRYMKFYIYYYCGHLHFGTAPRSVLGQHKSTQMKKVHSEKWFRMASSICSLCTHRVLLENAEQPGMPPNGYE